VGVGRRLAYAAVRRHARLRPVLPRGYHAYPTAGGWTYLDLRESPMMLARALRVYEPQKVDVLRSVLRPGNVFVDVGGNKGDFALLAARLMGGAGRVLCFEPEPDNVHWIERSAKRNQFAIEVVPVALADKPGTATLHLGEKSGWHSLLATDGVAITGELEIVTERLDDALAERGIDQVDVIKIDVEGAENAVLDGATRALSGSHPMTVLLDIHPGRGIDPVAICTRLRDWGFTINEPVGPQTKSVVATRVIR
jgi:FkbM family methyltransferase